MDISEAVEAKFRALQARLDEATLRLWAAAEARSLGRGGVSLVAKAIGISRTTIYAGLAELEAAGGATRDMTAKRIRAPGGGRKRLTELDARLLEHLDALVEPTSRGDPMSALRWTCKSTTRLAEELNRLGHRVSQRTICDLLTQTGYSLQSVRKTREGAQHPDRDAQFHYIADKVAQYQRQRQPVISVDTKKKELIGDFKNAGREWQPKGQPEQARVHDFIDDELGKVAPYGVYDVTANEGWVSVGINHDTAEFAVQSIRRWWLEMGRPLYPKARRLLVTADCGGSNGYRVRLWRVQLQRLADELGFAVQVCHFPPGTSKWNKIEHRLFCHITNNWRGRPLLTRQVVVNLIGSVSTAEGLKVRAELDENMYDAGIKVSDAELAAVAIERDEFHGEWNYRIKPRTSRRKT
ncbi:ISAzo13 family transposase [Cupriavidus sp. CV2]|uniref:ISAzo13 family transposase n=1 Tax=Cupriavidus TaxID=106589 RepID=UPI00291617A0|nr:MULTISPECIES: ISAzo13 family transposase [unclassified Cupriavidus]MDW3689235.1 ISAzo13 family transposase [Cupriavidus sp. CV2]